MVVEVIEDPEAVAGGGGHGDRGPALPFAGEPARGALERIQAARPRDYPVFNGKLQPC